MQKERQLATKLGTSTYLPRVGEVLLFHIQLKKILEQHGFSSYELNALSCSNASTSSSSSSSWSSKKKKSTTGKGRFCIVQKIKENGIEVLPIASFGGKILTTNDRLFAMVLAIDPLPPPTNTQALKIKLLKRTYKLLHGYVILIPVFIPNQTTWPLPSPVFVDRRDMLHIDSELAQRQFQQQDIDEDKDSEESAYLIPETRGSLFSINDMDKYNQTRQWINEHLCSSRFTDVDE